MCRFYDKYFIETKGSIIQCSPAELGRDYFTPFFFEAVVSVNCPTFKKETKSALDSVDTVDTLFISVSTALPKTAYVKMIDIWLIFAQLVPWTV